MTTQLDSIVRQILAETQPTAGVIFESNRVLSCLRPDLCLAAALSPIGERKPSFDLVEQRMDAMVGSQGTTIVIAGERLCFHLRSLERISAPMLAWLRERLENTAG